MPLIPDELIDEIQARTDIVEVVGRYVPLKRAGRHYKALCPFHKEKTPSFVVNTDKQIFHCFGCGVGGNVFGFLMQHDRLTFPEAVHQLGDHVGVALPTSEASASNGQAERLSALLEQICQYFERRLADPKYGRAARAYLAKRGVGERTRATFRLGVSPPGWDGLLRATGQRGVSHEFLEGVGLIIRGSQGPYDRFRNRLIFPILDPRGKVVGFGGRSLDGREPKYLNSPESPIYHKGRQLFGLSQAKDAILARKTATVVEGYFDCVVLAEAGFANVVSPLGTALTEEQVRLLGRYAQEVVLAFDADAAGELATLRGIDLLVEAGVQVRIAQLPSNVDPDEYVRSGGPERFEQLLRDSVEAFAFLLGVAARRFPLDHAEGMVQAAQFILPTIAKVPNAMLRREYVRLLGERLRLDEAAVLEELRKVTPREAMRATPPKALGVGTQRLAPAVRDSAQGAERLFVALLLDDLARWELLQATFSLDEVTEPSLRHIVALIAECAEAGPVQVAQIVSRLTAEGKEASATDLIEYASTIPAKEQAFADCVRRLHLVANKRRAAQLREQIQMAQEAGQDARVQELLTTYQRGLKGGG